MPEDKLAQAMAGAEEDIRRYARACTAGVISVAVFHSKIFIRLNDLTKEILKGYTPKE